MKKSEKSIDMSLKDIAEALNKSNYKGFMLYMNKDTLDAAFSICGENKDILLLLHEAYKKNEDFFTMIAASVFAHAATDKKAFAIIKKIYKVIKETE